MARVLYMVIDLKDKLELPLFVGTIDKVAEFTGRSKDGITSSISHAKKGEQ